MKEVPVAAKETCWGVLTSVCLLCARGEESSHPDLSALLPVAGREILAHALHCMGIYEYRGRCIVSSLTVLSSLSFIDIEASVFELVPPNTKIVSVVL